MILRAIFWIGLVAILMPGAVDLRPDQARAPRLLSGIKSAALHRLIEVRHELAEAERTRTDSEN